MQVYEIRITKRGSRDIRQLSAKMISKLKSVLSEVIAKTPYEGKRLVGDVAGNFSLRLNIQDRIVYSIDEDNKIVYIKRARTHSGE